MLEINRILQIIGFTTAQAFLSALASMFFGFLGAQGLWSVSKSKSARGVLSGFALLPNTLPIIFVIFSFLKYLPLARGFLGIVLAHCFLNSGLVAIAIYQLLQSKIGALAEIAWIEGCGRIRFIFKVALPYLKNDLLRTMFFVFAISFTSFAVPLMIGGSQGTSLEVLIYEKIRVTNEWSEAFVLVFAEIVFIMAISFFIRRQVAPQTTSVSKSPLLSSNFGIFILVTPAIFILFCLAQSFKGHLRLWPSLDSTESSGEILSLTLGSYFVAIGSGLMTLIFLFLAARFRPTPIFRRFYLGLASPSAVFVGFLLIWLNQSTGWATICKLIFGLTIMHLPILYRLSWDSQIFAVSSQIETGQILGASRARIFSKLVAPQILRGAYNLAGLAALWAFSDFTLASIVAEKNVSLAQYFSHLTESYRWEQAESLMLPMIFGSILCYFIFSGVGYVTSRSALR